MAVVHPWRAQVGSWALMTRRYRATCRVMSAWLRAARRGISDKIAWVNSFVRTGSIAMTTRLDKYTSERIFTWTLSKRCLYINVINVSLRACVTASDTFKMYQTDLHILWFAPTRQRRECFESKQVLYGWGVYNTLQYLWHLIGFLKNVVHLHAHKRCRWPGSACQAAALMPTWTTG